MNIRGISSDDILLKEGRLHKHKGTPARDDRWKTRFATIDIACTANTLLETFDLRSSYVTADRNARK